MNQDNKEFELSGTLGSLSNAALDNLAIQNSNETEEIVSENINVNGEMQLEPSSGLETAGEIEMLDLDFTPVDNGEPITEANLNQESTVNNTPELELTNGVTPSQNLDPIPTNFDIGDIGSIPPIDPTNNKKKKGGNKLWFVILIIIFIITVGALIFYYLRVSKGTLANAVVTKEIKYEMGEELSSNINDYATFKSISSNNCVLNTNNVDVTNAGTYEYSITCGSKVYKGNVIVSDNSAPVVETKTIVKKINDTIEPKEFISNCNEASECSYAFENADEVTTNLQTAGVYELNINVSDSNNNTTTTKVKLIVIDSDIKVYLNCALSDQNEEGFAGTITYTDKIGIGYELQYVGIYFKTKEYQASNEEEYNRIKNEYQNNNILNINNGVGKPVFDDENLTITIEEILSGPADFGDSFAKIKNDYETNKKYKCNIVNVN
ncbi:MAG: hypothetical protein IJN03_01820 [Bacilli bacterium]|nr:hypothetical protein [Bacilli bacterium]